MHNKTGTIWKIDGAGKVTKILTDFHSHNLLLDVNEHLWIGDNRWIQGEIEGEGIQTLLKITNNGDRDTLIRTFDRDEFFANNFAIDNHENIYFSLHNRIYKKRRNHPTELFLPQEFGRINTIYWDRNNNLWITDKEHKNGTLFRWNVREGLVEFATNLLPKQPKDPIFRENRLQIFYGIAEDKTGQIYVADNVSRHLLKITPSGEVREFYKSESFWHPVGVSFHEGGAYILEAGFKKTNIGPRIIKLTSNGKRSLIFDYALYEQKGDAPVIVPGTPTGPPFLWFLLLFVIGIGSVTFLVFQRKQKHQV